MNIFTQFFKSLYSPKHIASFRFQGIGKTILFAFLLAFVSILPTAIYSTSAILDGVDETAKALKTDFPAFQIKDGTLHSEENRPQVIYKGDIEIHFDSTGELKADDLLDTSTIIVGMLKKEIVVMANGSSQSIPYSMFQGLTIDNETASNFLKTAQSSLYIFIGLVIFIMYLVTATIQFLEITLLAYIGQLLISMTGRRANYGQLWRMSTYSFTLAITFFTIMNFIMVPVIGAFYVKWFVTIMVLYLAIKEMPVPKSKQAA